ncbi:MAG: parB-like partition protein, partial [Propionibacteriaceae bacterium]|nr:parB-like partition protein [Propionibacteriaceae bacterium]
MTTTTERRGLGRGLGELFLRTDVTPPAESTAEPELRPAKASFFAELPVDSISPNPRQPRTVFD